VSQANSSTIDTNQAIQWFREASPYINEHRARTVVLLVPDRLLASDVLATLTHDLTLLSHLGVRLLVCFGLRSDIDSRLKAQPAFHSGRRVTDDEALKTVIEAAGVARCELEARLSMGLPNTPMAGAHLSVCSGNFITARPYGIHDGIDFQHTGTVREVQTDALTTQLEAGHLVIVPPLGYSLTGEVFNLPAEEVAMQTAIALRAMRECSAEMMLKLAAQQNDDAIARTYQRAAAASAGGVPRVHLLPDHDPNALLKELFTVDGVGTMISAEHYENLRLATIQDVGGLIELIEPLQQDGTLVQRTREQLELDIGHFVVCERDGKVVACAALFLNEPNTIAEVACLVTHPQYQGGGRAAKLLNHLEKQALRSGAKTLSIRTTRAAHWFIERGFAEADVNALPEARRQSHNPERNSRVFAKSLT